MTDRGQPIALLVPVPQGSVIEALIAMGRAEPATGDLLELGPPLRPAKRVPLPSKILTSSRDAER